MAKYLNAGARPYAVHTVLQNNVEPDWYQHAFGELYPIVYAHRTVEAAAREVRFAIDHLELQSGDRVLDIGCGNGRHMVHLRRCGIRVTGLDFSPTLLDSARGLLEDCPHLVRGDMRALPFLETFDALVSFFTSFGYFLEPGDDAFVVAGMATALRPGGRFFLDYINAPQVAKSLVPRSVRCRGRYEIHEVRWLDHAARRVNKYLEVFENGRAVHASTESVRLYSEFEMRTLLNEGGLEVVRMFGDYDGCAYTAQSPRMIAVGRRTSGHA